MTGHAGDDTATETLLERRARLLGPNVPTFYDTPVHIVRGEGVWLWDKAGRKYLDGYNNVPHVGHGHPRVVAAIADQAALLNTHTRYLHEGVLDYIEALTARFGHGLGQAIMVCTGSEANDIALRMARSLGGRSGIVATDAAMTQAEAKRVAIAAHDGLARAIAPAHTLLDGDLIFVAATGAVPLSDPIVDPIEIGHAAATCVARAVARGVYCASSVPTDRLPSWQDRFR